MNKTGNEKDNVDFLVRILDICMCEERARVQAVNAKIFLQESVNGLLQREKATTKML